MGKKKCNECDKKFMNKRSLDTHMQEMHNVKPNKANAINPLMVIGGTFIVGILALALVSGVFSNQVNQTAHQTGNVNLSNLNKTGLNIGDYAPEFSVTTIDGKTVKLSDLTKEKKPVVIEFFATWCPHCRNDMTVLKEVYPSYSDKVEFLAIGMDLKEGKTALTNYKNQNGYPVTFATGNPTVVRNYAVTYTTTKYFIGKDGKIVDRKIGEESSSAWHSRLTALST